MQTDRANGKKPIELLYSLGLMGMLLILVIIHTNKNGQNVAEYTESYRNISNAFTLDREGTQPVDLKQLGIYMNPQKGMLSIYYQLPELKENVSLVYRSKDVYTHVLAEDKQIYETTVYESRFYNRSPGNLWNMVTIAAEYSLKCLEIQIMMVYDTSAITVDSLYLGDKGDILLQFLRSNLVEVFVSFLLMIVGFCMIVLDLLPAYAYEQKSHGLFWIGMFGLLTGIWSMIETNTMQFFVRDMRILQLIDNMVMIVDSMPLLLYLNCEYQIFKHLGMRILGYVEGLYILCCVGIQLYGKIDLHYMIHGAMLIMIVSDILIFGWIINTLRRLRKERKPVLNCALQMTGMCSLWVFGIIELMRSLQVDRIDRAGLVRMGMLTMSLCFGISSQIRTHRLLEQGLKYDLISHLAYSDGLTGLGNRTAYLEQLQEDEENAASVSQVGVVYLDVNNLKKVNDTQGHEFGDQLIKLAAHIIEESFGRFGKAYRIGGDEFCVLITGYDTQEQYEKGLALFQQLVAEANREKHFSFEVQIAQGFALCTEAVQQQIDEAVAAADSAMYQNKVFLKQYGKS